MSKYTLQVNEDGAVVNEWFGLTIVSVAVLVEACTVGRHALEEFLTDLMIDSEATVSTWSNTVNTVYYGHKEI